jgi:hypothetical protein
MINRQEYERGLLKEKHHTHTYKWLLEYYKKTKQFPKEIDFLLHLVEDNIITDANYYNKK